MRVRAKINITPRWESKEASNFVVAEKFDMHVGSATINLSAKRDVFKSKGFRGSVEVDAALKFGGCEVVRAGEIDLMVAHHQGGEGVLFRFVRKRRWGGFED